MEKKSIEIEETMTRTQVADFFRKVAEGLQSGSIELKSAEETLTLTPAELISVEIGAKQKKDKTKFSLEIAWRCRETAAGGAEEVADEKQGENSPC